MVKFIYRMILVVMIIAALWCVVNYVMNVRSGENLQQGVELVKDLGDNIKGTWCNA